MTTLKELRDQGTVGADMSPGDPVCAWAADEIERLQAELRAKSDDHYRVFLLQKHLADDYNKLTMKFLECRKECAELRACLRTIATLAAENSVPRPS